MSEAPIIRTTVPVTTGGKIRLRVLAGAKDKPMFSKEQSIDVPIEALAMHHQHSITSEPSSIP